MKLPKQKIGDLFEVQLGKMLNENARVGELFPYLANFNVRWGKFDLSDLNRMAFSETERKKFTIQKHDLLMCEGGEIGRCAVWTGSDTDVYFQKAIHRLRPRDERVNSYFMYYYMQHISTKGDLPKLVGETSIAHLTREKLVSLSVPVPQRAVQDRIVEVLLAWDAAIEKTEQLIFLRKKQKAGLLLRLVAALSTFTKLGDFLESSSRSVPKPIEPYWALGIRSHGKGTFQRFIENPNSVAMEQLYALNCGDVIVNITFAWEGAIATVKPEDINCLVSHRFPTYRVDRERADPEFVKHIINRKEFFSQLALISPGGAGRNRVLNKKDFLKLTVPMPPLAEQKRLARILTTLDDLIANQQSLLASLAIQKRGLMQKLLTGQWRVKLPDTEKA